MLHIITRAYRFDLLFNIYSSLPKVDDIHWHICKSNQREDIEHEFLKKPFISIYNIDCLDSDRTAKTNYCFNQIHDGYFCLVDDDTIFHEHMYRVYQMCSERNYVGMVIGEQLDSDGKVKLKAQAPVAGKIDTGQCLAHSSCLSSIKWPDAKTLLRDFMFWDSVYNFFNKICVYANRPISWYNKSVERMALLLYKPTKEHIEILKKIAPSWKIMSTLNLEEAKCWMENAEVVMGNHNLIESLPYNKRLKWIQTSSVGVDRILNNAKEIIRDIALSNAKGMYTTEMCEHTIALLFMIYRELHLIRDSQHKHQWRRSENLKTLKGKNALILGYGSLGKAIGDKLQAFGVNVFGVTHTINTFNNTHWKDMLGEIHFVILCLPSTPETKLIVGAKELNKLNESSIVINVGRSDSIDQQHLFELLKDNKIKGAALDVFSEEPLPEEHPCWDIPNLFVSPHTARSKETNGPVNCEKLFELNFKNYVTKGMVYNLVNKQKGY